jgi:hypothetical protein
MQWSNATLTDYYSFLITVHGTLLSLPSPVPRHQNRKMKGVALFQKIKELRENTERLNDIRLAFQEEAQEAEIMATSTLSAASATSLVCELLPLLSKSQPKFLSARVKDLVYLPWTANRGDEAQLDIEEGEATESYQEDEAGEAPGRAIQIDADPIARKKRGGGRGERPTTAQPTGSDIVEEEDDIEEF